MTWFIDEILSKKMNVKLLVVEMFNVPSFFVRLQDLGRISAALEFLYERLLSLMYQNAVKLKLTRANMNH